MAKIEKISIALPAEMLEKVREAVEAGEYASTSEVMRDALRDWQTTRTEKLLQREEAIQFLRQKWQEAIDDPRPAVPMGDVMERLIRKYKAMADAAEVPKKMAS